MLDKDLTEIYGYKVKWVFHRYNTIMLMLSITVLTKGGIPPNLDDSISIKTSPIRLGRSFARNTTPCGYKSFAYRNY